MKVEVNGDRKPKPLSTTGPERNWRAGLCSGARNFANASCCQSFRVNVSSSFCWFFAVVCFFCACKCVVGWCEWFAVFTLLLAVCFCQFDSFCVDCGGLVPGEISLEFGGVCPRLFVACFARSWPRCVYRGHGELNHSVFPW